MSITQIAGNGIKSRGMWTPFVLRKPDKSLQGRGSDTNARLALNVKCQIFAIRR